MPGQDVETVRRIYALAREEWGGGEARDRDDRRAALTRELWDPEVVIEENAAFPDRDTYHGYAGLVRWWTAFFEIYDEVRMEPQEFIPHGDRIVVHVHQHLRSRMGVALEQDFTHVWTLRAGRVIHVTGYRDRAEALAAVGLSEEG